MVRNNFLQIFKWVLSKISERTAAGKISENSSAAASNAAERSIKFRKMYYNCFEDILMLLECRRTWDSDTGTIPWELSGSGWQNLHTRLLWHALFMSWQVWERRPSDSMPQKDKICSKISGAAVNDISWRSLETSVSIMDFVGVGSTIDATDASKKRDHCYGMKLRKIKFWSKAIKMIINGNLWVPLNVFFVEIYWRRPKSASEQTGSFPLKAPRRFKQRQKQTADYLAPGLPNRAFCAWN